MARSRESLTVAETERFAGDFVAGAETDVHRQPQTNAHRDEAGPSVAHERQRQPGDRHQPDRHPRVDDQLRRE